MRKTVWASLAVISILSGAPSFAAAQGQNPSAASPGNNATITVQGQRQDLTSKRRKAHWYRAESQHFIIYTEVKREDATFLLNQLERFRYVLRGYLHQGGEPEIPEAKAEIYYLSQPQDLDIIPHPFYHDPIGLYRSCEDGTQGYAVQLYYNGAPGSPLEKRPENEGLGYVFEAYARHYLYQHSFDRSQVWFIDGFAHYFSTLRFDGNEAILGLAPQPFANILRSPIPSKLNYKDVLTAEQTDVQLSNVNLDAKMEYQARAWVLVHYILSSPENLKKYGAYLQAIDAGTEPVKAFEAAFDMTPAKFEEISSQLLHGQLEATKAIFKALPEADVSFFTLPESADKLLLWGSALKTCPSPGDGKSFLGKIRNEAPKYPDSVLAQRILSLAEAGWGDPNVAIAHLSKDKTEDFEGLYLLGRAELSLAKKSTGDARTTALKAARQAFAQASLIDATSTPTAWYYYRTAVLMDGKPDEDAQSAALIAWHQAPEIDTYAFHAGLVYAWLGRKEEALQALKTVADNPRGRELRPVAQAWMARIQAGADEASLLAAMQADYPSQGGGLYELTRASADTVRSVRGVPAQ